MIGIVGPDNTANLWARC